jgi:hypothetical protein
VLVIVQVKSEMHGQQNTKLKLQLVQFTWANIIVFHAEGISGRGYSLHLRLVVRQACCCVLCYWHGRHACYIFVLVLDCVLLVRHAMVLHRSKRHGTYMGTRGEPLLDKKLCVDAISENFFINYTRKQFQRTVWRDIPTISVQWNFVCN